MISNVFAVLDVKVGSFAQPFFSPNKETARRAFLDACMDPSTLLAKHPADYCLFHLGEFDDETGYLHAAVKPENLGTAASFLANVKGN